jgi:hypothetical protein
MPRRARFSRRVAPASRSSRGGHRVRKRRKNRVDRSNIAAAPGITEKCCKRQDLLGYLSKSSNK